MEENASTAESPTTRAKSSLVRFLILDCEFYVVPPQHSAPILSELSLLPVCYDPDKGSWTVPEPAFHVPVKLPQSFLLPSDDDEAEGARRVVWKEASRVRDACTGIDPLKTSECFSAWDPDVLDSVLYCALTRRFVGQPILCKHPRTEIDYFRSRPILEPLAWRLQDFQQQLSGKTDLRDQLGLYRSMGWKKNYARTVHGVGTVCHHHGRGRIVTGPSAGKPFHCSLSDVHDYFAWWNDSVDPPLSTPSLV